MSFIKTTRGELSSCTYGNSMILPHTGRTLVVIGNRGDAYRVYWNKFLIIKNVTLNNLPADCKQNWVGKSLFFFLAMFDEHAEDDYSDVFNNLWSRRDFVKWAFVAIRPPGYHRGDDCVTNYHLGGSYKWSTDADLYFLGVYFRVGLNKPIQDTTDRLKAYWKLDWVPPHDREAGQVKVPEPIASPPKTRAEIAADKKAAKVAESIMKDVENSKDFFIEVKINIRAFPKIEPILVLNGFTVFRDGDVATVSCV